MAAVGLDKYGLFSTIESRDRYRIVEMTAVMGNDRFEEKCKGRDIYLNNMAIWCYSEGLWRENEGYSNISPYYMETAVLLWERVFTECPDSPLAPAACFSAAAQTAQELGDYSAAIEYFQKVADDWPDYEHAPWALFQVVEYLELMAQKGLLRPEKAKPRITAAMTKLIENYPETEFAERAREILEFYKNHEPGEKIMSRTCN